MGIVLYINLGVIEEIETFIFIAIKYIRNQIKRLKL